MTIPAAVWASPATASSGAAGYRLTEIAKGEVLRWDPCRSIPIRLNTRYAPAGARADVQEALRRVAGHTGLRFEYVGETRRIPQRGRQAKKRQLVIAWAYPGTGPGRSDLLSKASSGMGTWRWRKWRDDTGWHRPRIVSGAVVLNAAQNDRFRPGFGPGVTRGSLLLHELGHAVGLGHVSDRDQIMYPVMVATDESAFGPGDKAGLRAVGEAKGCIR